MRDACQNCALALVVAVFPPSGHASMAAGAITTSPRERISINDNWRFFLGDPPGQTNSLLYDVRPPVANRPTATTQSLDDSAVSTNPPVVATAEGLKPGTISIKTRSKPEPLPFVKMAVASPSPLGEGRGEGDLTDETKKRQLPVTPALVNPSRLVQCLTNNRFYFEQEITEETEKKTLFSLFPPVKNNTSHLRDITLVRISASRRAVARAQRVGLRPSDFTTHWVGTWACGPQLTEPQNLPPAPLANSTLRQFVHVTLGGKQLRVRFSNAYGTNSVTLNSVRVALAAGGGSATDGAISAATDKALNFNGAASATIPAGQVVVSDPFDFDLPQLTSLAVTIYFGEISATTITGHPGSRTTSFIQSGNSVSAATLPAAAKAAHWYLLAGIDVQATEASRAVVILGDSITDGRGSTTDGNNRWPDSLAQRLHTNAPTAAVSVLNMGIGGNGVFGGLGPSAQKRFGSDVLNQSGARWLIVFEGVNDIGRGTSAQSLTNAYAEFIDQAHAHNLQAYGATITPFGKSFYDQPAHERVRQAVNSWIRTSGKFDAVIDFDATVRDPANPTRLRPAYDTGDHLHLNPAGYQAMADSIELNLFAQ